MTDCTPEPKLPYTNKTMQTFTFDGVEVRTLNWPEHVTAAVVREIKAGKMTSAKMADKISKETGFALNKNKIIGFARRNGLKLAPTNNMGNARHFKSTSFQSKEARDAFKAQQRIKRLAKYVPRPRKPRRANFSDKFSRITGMTTAPPRKVLTPKKEFAEKTYVLEGAKHPQGISIKDDAFLLQKHCRFPVRTEQELIGGYATHFYCGEDVELGKHYCDSHAALMFRKDTR